MITVEVRAGGGSYPVVVGAGARGRVPGLLVPGRGGWRL